MNFRTRLDALEAAMGGNDPAGRAAFDVFVDAFRVASDENARLLDELAARRHALGYATGDVREFLPPIETTDAAMEEMTSRLGWQMGEFAAVNRYVVPCAHEIRFRAVTDRRSRILRTSNPDAAKRGESLMFMRCCGGGAREREAV